MVLLVDTLQKNLKVADVGYRVGSNILRVYLKAGKYIPEKLGSRRFKTTTYMISKHHYFTLSRGRRVFRPRNSPPDLILLQ